MHIFFKSETSSTIMILERDLYLDIHRKKIKYNKFHDKWITYSLCSTANLFPNTLGCKSVCFCISLISTIYFLFAIVSFLFFLLPLLQCKVMEIYSYVLMFLLIFTGDFLQKSTVTFCLYLCLVVYSVGLRLTSLEFSPEGFRNWVFWILKRIQYLVKSVNI